MLNFFIYLSKSEWDYCRAPLAHADPVPNLKIRYAQVLIRHGMRSPIYSGIGRDFVGQWNCDDISANVPRRESAPQSRYRYYNHKIREASLTYPPSCQSGELTVEGQEMHVELGSYYRDYYLNQLHLIPEKYDASKVGFHSSPIDRCLRSGSSFMLGLYPPIDPNEVINIETGASTRHPLLLNDEHCPEMAEATKNFLSSDLVRDYVEKTISSSPKLVEVLDTLHLGHDWTGIQTVSEWALAFNCSKNQAPAWLTDEIMEISREASRVDQVGKTNSSSAVYASYLMNFMMELADSDLNMRNGKVFNLLSSHDTSLTSLLVLLGQADYKEPAVPRYRSHIAMELWENPENGELYVRFVYNGEELVLPEFGKALVPLDHFRFWQKPLTNHCPL